jgi:outer membrane protein OmpA-like peptidoglycan-associated protein
MAALRITRSSARRTLLGALSIALLLLLLAGCGDEGAVVEETAEPAAEPAEPEPADEHEEPVDEPEPAAGEPELVWSATHENPINGLAASPDGETLAVGEWATYLHQAADGRLLDVFVHSHSPDDLAFSPDGEVLGVGLGLGGVLLVDPADGTELATVGSGFDNRLAFSPDGSQLATGNRDGVVWLWSGDGADPLGELDDDAEYIDSLEYHPDGDLLAAVDFSCVARIWDLTTEEVRTTLELESGMSSCYWMDPFAFSPDGDVMAGAVVEDWEPYLQLLSVDDATVLWEISVLPQVRGMEFAPDGGLLAVASREATTLVDVDNGEVAHTLSRTYEAGEESHPSAVAFTPDGGHVAVGYWDGTVELWRLPGAEELVAPEVEPCDPLPLPGDVLFDTGSSELRAEADDVLAELAEQLQDGFPEATLTFVGHTDSRGDAAANQQLSLDRAEAVASWMEDWAADNGVDGWSLDVDGQGDTELKVTDTNADGEFLAEAGALNRRVEIEIEADGCA